MLPEDAEETENINTENDYHSDDEDSALTSEKSYTNESISNSSQSDIANTSKPITPNITTHCTGKRRKPRDPVSEQIINYLNSKKSPSEHPQVKTNEEYFALSIVPTLKRMTDKQKALAKIRIQQLLYEIEFSNE